MQRELLILGLGNNVGDRLRTLQQAAAALRGWLGDLRCSPVYESAPLLPEGAPKEWNMPFYNAACAGWTEYTPQEVFLRTKQMEHDFGRIDRGRWGPRELDIDILAYGVHRIDMPQLTIPHSQLLTRNFALLPLADVAPDWIYPATGKTARMLAGALPPDGIIRVEGAL
jgi:2-amino-4-hydroxy-6-hydroxymethyldihydropteridine diphosphokinase